MADPTYQPGVYRERGGDRLVVASSGEIDIEAGGRQQIAAVDFITTGGKIDLSSAGNFVSSGIYAGSGPIDSQRGYKSYVEEATSSIASIVNYGLTKLRSSTALTIGLDNPVAGMEKWLLVLTSGASVTITTSSAGGQFTTGGNVQMVVTSGLSTAPAWIHLLGLNSTAWLVLGFSTGLASIGT